MKSDVGLAVRLWRWTLGRPAKHLVGTESGRTILLTLFIPSVDRDSKPVNQAFWKRKALEWLGQTFGGATAYPPGLGVWRDDGRGGRLVFDETIVIMSYMSKAAIDANIANLRGFMTRMGRETNQGSVAYVLRQEFCEIPID